jgi:hypothetical protein
MIRVTSWDGEEATRMMRTLVVLLLSGIVLVADDDTPLRTGGVSNGRLWNMLDNSAIKELFVIAANEGFIAQYMQITCSDKAPSDFIAVSLTRKEEVAALDEFYKEPVNAPIPIVYAIGWVRSKAAGSSETELKGFEQKLRALAARSAEPPKQ